MKYPETASLIKSFRLKLGVTQKEFAELFDSTRNRIARYELGQVSPPGDMVLKIQKFKLNNNRP